MNRNSAIREDDLPLEGVDKESLLFDIVKAKDNEERAEFLRRKYLRLYLALLKVADQYAFDKFCINEIRHNAEEYTVFAVDFLLPWFEQFKRKGEIKLGKKKIRIVKGQTWDYEGYLDEKGHATGHGVATSNDGCKYKGTFVENHFEGIGIFR